MGKKKKALLDLKRFGKVRKKWESKFAKFLNLQSSPQKKEEKSIDEVPHPVEEEKIQEEEPVIDTPKVEEKPKTTRKRKTPTKKATPATKKTTSTTRKRRTTKTKPDA